MIDHGPLSLVPPVLAIALAILTRQVYVSLFCGIWIGWAILAGGNPVLGLVDGVEGLVAVFGDPGRARILLIAVLIGALLTLTQVSGGVAGFVAWVGGRGWVTTRRAAGALAWLLGFFIFVESIIGVLVAGTVCRPLFDRFGLSRERLAYVLDSTCAPKAILLPLNSWGAYVIGLLATQQVDRPVAVLLQTIPLNFYALGAVALALLTATTGLSIGPMRRAERRVREEGRVLREGAEPLVAAQALTAPVKDGVAPRARNMVVPLAALIVTLPVALWITGDGNLMSGSGDVSAFWAIVCALLVAGIAFRWQRIFTVGETVDLVMRGIGSLVPVGVLLVLAFAIGDVCAAIGTGPYVAQISRAGVPAGLMPAALFLVSCAISFSTGTSYGTWAIMVPIAASVASGFELSIPLAMAAVLGGGLFGDHASPISDSTIVSSMAAGTDHIDHVRTQLPYAVLAATGAVALYLAAGALG